MTAEFSTSHLLAVPHICFQFLTSAFSTSLLLSVPHICFQHPHSIQSFPSRHLYPWLNSMIDGKTSCHAVTFDLQSLDCMCVLAQHQFALLHLCPYPTGMYVWHRQSVPLNLTSRRMPTERWAHHSLRQISARISTKSAVF